MLRPKVYIKNITTNTIIKVESLTTKEDRTGVSCSINTICKTSNIKIGDILYISLYYDNEIKSVTVLPLMIITKFSINSNYSLRIDAVDEFNYYCDYTNFAPIDSELTDSQRDFLITNCGYVSKGDTSKFSEKDLPSITISELMAYVQSLILPKMYYYKTTANASTIKSYRDPGTDKDHHIIYKKGMFLIERLKDNIGKINNVRHLVSVKDVIKLVSNHTLFNFYMTSTSFNQKTIVQNIYENTEDIQNKNNLTTYAPHRVIVNDIAATSASELLVKDKQKYYTFRFIDNFNMLPDDSLVYNNPTMTLNAVRGTFPYSKKVNGKVTTSTEVWYAYYDSKGEKKIISRDDIDKKNNESVNKELSNYTCNEITIKQNGENKYTVEQIKELMTKKLDSIEYFGYIGSFTTLNYNLNVFDIISLTFNNTDRKSSNFGITSINRKYDSNGLFMEIELRQEQGVIQTGKTSIAQDAFNKSNLNK